MTPVISLPSVREILGVAFCYKWRIIFAFLLPVVAAVGVSSMMKPIYSADSEVLVRPGHEYMPPSDVPHGNELPPQITMQETIDNEIAILTSSDLIREIVDQIGAVNLYPGLATVHPREVSVEKTAASWLSHDLLVTPVKLSNVIDVSVRNTSRSVALVTLQHVLKEFEQLHLAAFRRDRSSVLQEQLGSDTRALQRLEVERASYETSQNLFAFVEQRSSLIQQRARDADVLRTASLDRAALTEQLGYLRQALAHEPATITVAAGDQETPMIAEARQRVEALREQKQSMLVFYPLQSPYIKPVLSQLRIAEQELARVTTQKAKSSSVTRGPNPLAASLKQQIYAAETSLAPLEAKIAIMKNAIAEDDRRLTVLTNQDVDLADLDRRVTQLAETTDTLRQRLVDARFLEELDKAGIASLAVIEQPVAMVKPVFPRKSLFVLGGMVIGVMSGTLMLLMSLTTGNRFLMIETVERLLSIPLVVGLPAIPRRRLRELKVLTTDGLRPAQLGESAS